MQIATLGVRDSKTFNTKAEALAWAAKRELEVSADEARLYRDLTCDAISMGYDGIVAALDALGANNAAHGASSTPEAPGDWGPPKPGDRRGELVKAGALVLAEIERMDRAAQCVGSPGEGA